MEVISLDKVCVYFLDNGDLEIEDLEYKLPFRIVEVISGKLKGKTRIIKNPKEV